VGLSRGRLLEGTRQSDREIMEKYKVTNIALKALEGLKRKYGKNYAKHMEDVKSKVKYFSGYVMHGDPIEKLSILKKKLKHARSLIQRKKKFGEKRKRKRRTKKRGSKEDKKLKEKFSELLKDSKNSKKRKLFIGDMIKDGIGALTKGAGKAYRNMQFKLLLETDKKPSFKKVLQRTRLGSPKKFIRKNLGPPAQVNKEAIKTGTLPILIKLRIILKKKGLDFPLRFNFKKMIGISPGYVPALKKMDALIKSRKKKLEGEQKKLDAIKKKLRQVINDNDKEFKQYKATTQMPKMGQKRKPNPNIESLNFEPNMRMTSFKGIDSIDCGQQMRKFLYKTVNKSELKEKYCKYVFSHFRKVRIKEILNYIGLARQEMLSILSMKRSLYCGICDATLQNNFDNKQKLILYSQRFCHDMVSQYKDYLKFRHIILVEFYDQFFQLINCFEFRNELGIDYPYRTMLESRKRRITSIRKCFENLNTPEFYKFCYFVCSQFNIIKFSPFFDGDLDLLKTLYAKFTTFIRRYRVYRKNFRKRKRKRKRRKRRKRKRRLRIKRGTSFKDALISPQIDTSTGVSDKGEQEQLSGHEEMDQKVSSTEEPRRRRRKLKKRTKKMSREDHVKLRTLKRHVDQVHNSLTDEISMLVLNHKKHTKQKIEELSDRKKYIKNYHDGLVGKKILSEKHIDKEVPKKRRKEDSIFLDSKPKIDFPDDVNGNNFFDDDIPMESKGDSKLEKKESASVEKEKTEGKGLWGGRRLASDITQTFSNELQNSMFMQRLAEENRKEAQLTEDVNLTSKDPENERNLRVKMTVSNSQVDAPAEAPPKKIKLPKPKPTFSYGVKKKKTMRARVRKKLSFLRFHTEADRLPVYYNYQINPNLKPTYSEVAMQNSIYLKTKLPFQIKTFRPFFAKSVHGFNPFRTTEMMRLDFDPRQIIALTRKKNYKPERLDGRVVTSYMAFDREYMAGFKHDIDLDFDRIGMTNDKNYTQRSVHPKFQMMKRGKYKKHFVRDDSKPFRPQSEWEFHNPDNQDLHGHYRKNVSNDPHAHFWYKLFGR
jgi:hypothetical protein